MIPQETRAPSIARSMPHRIAFAGGVLLLGFCVVLGRLHYLQVIKHEETLARVGDLHHQQRILPAHRGAILDRHGELLAHDKTTHDVYLDTLQLRDPAAVRVRLSRLEKTTVRDLTRKFSGPVLIERYREHLTNVLDELVHRDGAQPELKRSDIATMLADDKRAEVALLKGVREDEADEWTGFIDQRDLLGVSVRTAAKRAYPTEERLTHVLGHVNFENIGQAGIEATFNDILNGTDGVQFIERDRRGREIITRRGETVEPKNGSDVQLTIDMQLQEIMEETLEQAFAYYKPRKIISVLVEPHTGAVLAMASRPHFERDGMEGTMSNLAIGSQYEPGSVFKIITYAAAFDRGLIGLADTVNCDPDQRVFANLNIHDHVSGSVTIAQAFAQSSNRAAYLLAHRLGEDRYVEYVRKFGFGQKTGLPLTGEVSGHIIPQHTKAWNVLTLSRMAMGHSVTVTPLQMAMAASAIANGGTLMKPQLVQEIRDEHGKVLRSLTPEIVHRVCSERAASLLRTAMEGVVSDKGTGAKAAIPGVRVAGKTGTAQLYKTKETSHGKVVVIDEGHYCVSFAGFAPADKPELCAIVIVDDPHAPKEELLGGVLAGPIFAQLMKQCLEQVAVSRREAAAHPSLAEGGRR